MKSKEVIKNEIFFTGIGTINDKEIKITFKGNNMKFDQSNRLNPLMIINVIPNKDNDSWYEINNLKV
jgi:hypothetical protein